MTSGTLYSTVTKHWPRIAAGLVVVVAVADIVIGGLTADSRLEFYLLVWASTSGAIWFLFEKAESVLAPATRDKIVRWITEVDLGPALASLPDQFGALFDAVFGDRHLTVHCLVRSITATFIGLSIGFAAKLALGSWAGHAGSTLVFWALVTSGAMVWVGSVRWSLKPRSVVLYGFLGVLVAAAAIAAQMAQASGVPLFEAPRVALLPLDRFDARLGFLLVTVTTAASALAAFGETGRLGAKGMAVAGLSSVLLTWTLDLMSRIGGLDSSFYSLPVHLAFGLAVCPGLLLGVSLTRARRPPSLLILVSRSFLGLWAVALPLIAYDVLDLPLFDVVFGAVVEVFIPGVLIVWGGTLVLLPLLGYPERASPRRIARVAIGILAIPIILAIMRVVLSVGIGEQTLLFDGAPGDVGGDPTVPLGVRIGSTFGVLLAVALVNVISDYASLLETRWAIREMRGSWRTGLLLLFDLALTYLIWLYPASLAIATATMSSTFAVDADDVIRLMTSPLGFWSSPPSEPIVGLAQISLVSTFITSAWLWLYFLTRALAGLLLKANAGVGFLLRVTDVEGQPFRSMGFVSVIIVSGLFALGLPVVLL